MCFVFTKVPIYFVSRVFPRKIAEESWPCTHLLIIHVIEGLDISKTKKYQRELRPREALSLESLFLSKSNEIALSFTGVFWCPDNEFCRIN